MSRANGSEGVVEELERDILTVFGASIIEFEAVLFQKFLVLSGRHSLTTEDVFRRLLQDMHSKGYISPLELHNRKAWKKLVVENRLDDRLVPRRTRTTEDDAARMKGQLGTWELRHENMVSQSRLLADDILRTLTTKIAPSSQPDTRGAPELRMHVKAMRRALMESRKDFLDYLRTHAPNVQDEMKQILDSRGEEMLLVSLRLIEASI